jgi:hypothetical protein
LSTNDGSGFRYRVLWTWDHCTNWDPAQPGQQEEGCNNSYLKPSSAFLSDYTKVIDCMADLGLNGLIVWGFLRDAHGGEVAARELCRYANEKGVRILAGVGVMAYGGPYYQGNHPFSMEEWLRKHPEMSAVDEKGGPYNWQAAPGRPRMQVLCPSREENVQWSLDGVRWLVENFDIGGINYESGDYGVCHCPLCREKKSGVDIMAPGEETDRINVSFDAMAELYPLLMEAAHDIRPDLWQTYSPYCGYKSDMASKVRRFLDPIPDYAICQWTLTHMLRKKGGFPWEEGLRFPAKHNMGYFHQGSQWFDASDGEVSQGRYDSVVETIGRAAALGIRSGLEGLAMHGEVPVEHPAWAANYRAFSQSCLHPGESFMDDST